VAIGYFGAVPDFSLAAVIALSVAGILHFVWGRYCNYRSMRAIGTNLAAPVQQVNLIVTLIAAIWILGETLTPLRILGILLVLLGPSLTLREGPAAKAAAAAADAEKVSRVENGEPSAAIGNRTGATFEPHYAEGYLFALLSATGYGLSPILIRLALEQQGLGASITGGLISYTAATVIMTIVLVWPGQLRHVLAVTPESARWFTLSGIMVCISQMFLFMALAVAPVTVVAPISRLTIVLRIYFSRLLTPEHEVFGGRVIAGTLVSLAGAVLLSLSAEVVSSLLPLPEAVAAVLKWHWP
jgi:uncharacterized membrane protein